MNRSKTKRPPDALLLAEELYRLIGRSRRLLLVSAARRLEERGASILTWQVLCYLVRNGPTTQRDLGFANAQHPAGVSRLIDELEEEGLVRRRHDPDDRRKLRVEVTGQGKAWFDDASPAVIGAVEDAMVGLSQKQRVALRGLLEALLAGTAQPPLEASAE